MTGRRSVDKWTKWTQIATVAFFLIFVIIIGIGLNIMFNEIRVITKGQQALILNLTQKNIQKKKVPAVSEKASDQCVSKVSFIKYKSETNQEIKELRKKLELLKQRIRALKSPL